MRQCTRLVFSAALVLVLAAPLGELAAQAPAKKPVSYDAYDGWKAIQGTKV